MSYVQRWAMALCLCYPFILNADDLLPIDVIAQKNVSKFSFGSTFEIDEAELMSEPTGLISPCLAQVPGVVAAQAGGPGSSVSYFIRGTESRHVAFTLDGLKLNDPSSTTRQFDSAFFTSPMLQRIEVHKGPQAVLYGSDAMGGHIDMKTRKGEGAPETRLSLGAGSFGTFSSSLSKDWKSKIGNGTLTWSDFRTEGISRLNKKRFNATEKDSSRISQLSSSSEHRVHSKWKSDLLVSYLHGANELDGAITDNSYDKSENDQYILQQKTNHELDTNSAISLRNGLNRHNRYFRTMTQGKDSYAGDSYQNELLYTKNTKRIDFISGFSYEHEDFSQADLFKEFDLTSAFLQTLLKFDQLSFQAGLRADHHSRYGNFQTGSVGASYTQNAHQLSLQYSEGYKAPSLYQLFGPDLFGPVGNSKLHPERNKSLEGKWLWNDFEVSLFQNRMSDLIIFATNQGYQNQGHFISEGIEMGHTLRFKSLSINPIFTHQDFRKAQSTVLRRPKNSGALHLVYFVNKNLEFDFRARLFDERKDYDVSGNVVRLSRYEVADLGGKYSWNRNELGIKFLNIFDRVYEDLYGYSVMPRSVFMHYGLRF